MGPPVKRHLNGVSLADRSWSIFSGILDPLSPQQLKKQKTKKKTKKNVVIFELDPRADKTFWIRACVRTVKALARVFECAGLFEGSLLAYAIKTTIPHELAHGM